MSRLGRTWSCCPAASRVCAPCSMIGQRAGSGASPSSRFLTAPPNVLTQWSGQPLCSAAPPSRVSHFCFILCPVGESQPAICVCPLACPVCTLLLGGHSLSHPLSWSLSAILSLPRWFPLTLPLLLSQNFSFAFLTSCVGEKHRQHCHCLVMLPHSCPALPCPSLYTPL